MIAGFRGEIIGLARLYKRMAEIDKKAEAAAWRSLSIAAVAIHRDAVLSIQNGPKTGHTYGKHTASAPGQPPASDTGNLVSKTRIIPNRKGSYILVIASTPYAAALEFGARASATRDAMEPRPFMMPAFLKNQNLAKESLGTFWQ